MTYWLNKTVAGSGAFPPPLFLDQTEAQRPKKKFIGDLVPPLKVWICRCKPLRYSFALQQQSLKTALTLPHYLHINSPYWSSYISLKN